MYWIIEHLIVGYATHAKTVVPHMMFFVVAASIRLVHKLPLNAAHLMLRVGPLSTWLLAVALMPIPVVPMSIMSIHGACIMLTIAMSSTYICPKIKAISTVRVCAWISIAMVTMIANYTLYSLISFLGSFTIILSMTLSLLSLTNAHTIYTLMESAHCSMRRKNMSFASTYFWRSQTVWMSSAMP